MLITKMQWQGYGFFSLELTEPSRFEAYEHFIVQASNPCVYWLSGSGLCPNITRANEAETVRFRAGELTGENVEGDVRCLRLFDVGREGEDGVATMPQGVRC